MAGMQLSLVIAGSIPYSIAACSIILAAIAGTVVYWRVRKPRYDGSRVIVMAYVAAVVALLVLALWMSTA
jgi:hypothetical protein